MHSDDLLHSYDLLHFSGLPWRSCEPLHQCSTCIGLQRWRSTGPLSDPQEKKMNFVSYISTQSYL